MKFDIISLFPTYFDSPLNESLLKKAIANKLLQVNIHNLRDYSESPQKQVDDTPYGGGPGMVLKPDVLAKSIKDIRKENSLVILPDPSGVVFDHEIAKKLSEKEHLIFVCGRYEGVDQRFKDNCVDMEISLGDYVINGGEAATLVMIETISRLIPGFLGNTDSAILESFDETEQGNLLEYPQYTKPENFEGTLVPEILLSGNHKKIADWRAEKALEKTKLRRPDLLKI